jgi:gamma-glutamyl:cysteine ligase YbdK (ATP-grasp superfamily)
VDTSWLRTDLEEVIRRAPRDPAKHPDDYVELRVDDLDPLINAIVAMEAASEAAELAEAQRPPSDDDEPDELSLLVEKNLEHFEALIVANGGRVIR